MTRIVFLLGIACSAMSAGATEPPPERPHFVSSSLFMLVNLIPSDQSPGFAQLNFGRHLTRKDVLIAEAITWRYHAPLGVPLVSSATNTRFPGHVRAIGVGLAYQRFLWKGAYATLHVTPFHQRFVDQGGATIQSGFQLFVVGRLGYHLAAWNDRLFLEPSVAVTSWPINTNLPPAFAKQDDRFPGYFLEPGLNLGVNF